MTIFYKLAEVRSGDEGFYAAMKEMGWETKPEADAMVEELTGYSDSDDGDDAKPFFVVNMAEQKDFINEKVQVCGASTVLYTIGDSDGYNRWYPIDVYCVIFDEEGDCWALSEEIDNQCC